MTTNDHRPARPAARGLRLGPLVGRQQGNRRPILATLVIVVVVVVTGLVATTSATPVRAQEDPPPGLPEGDWTPEQVDYMLDLIQRTEEALPAFTDDGMLDEQLLQDLGFHDIHLPAPGHPDLCCGWDHWVNPGWQEDEHILDPEYPESLVFRRTEDGGRVLEAAMFGLSDDDTLDDVPDEIAWLPGWHTHPELATAVPMMHVWIVDNPCGHRFAGVDGGGLVCGSHDHDPRPAVPGPEAPPAVPVPGKPGFTG